ncbi:hypothetical protein GCM10010384_68580 [Streptomyces djakartensis]|uniref:Uncharacterized protein n=1 Tax=Streptomyces djakartensis TaxID=68193 RepID=A0ABQ3AJA3_9ACTN|nr:hypothetical protein GCM10010384_68580 [Streptomyces djakartensis]
MPLGPVVLLLLAGVPVMCDPLLAQTGRGGPQRTSAGRSGPSRVARATDPTVSPGTSWRGTDSPARGR